MAVPSGLLRGIRALRQTQQQLHPLHPAPQHGTQLPNLLALQTSSHSKDASQQPYHEDGFPDAGEVLCVLVNHFAHAADELGPGEPLAGRQLQAEGLKEGEERRTAPCIASRSQQLPAAGRHDSPQPLPACCLAARPLRLAKPPSPRCQPKVNVKIEEWPKLGNYGNTVRLPLPDTQRSTSESWCPIVGSA